MAFSFRCLAFRYAFVFCLSRSSCLLSSPLFSIALSHPPCRVPQVPPDLPAVPDSLFVLEHDFLMRTHGMCHRCTWCAYANSDVSLLQRSSRGIRDKTHTSCRLIKAMTCWFWKCGKAPSRHRSVCRLNKGGNARWADVKAKRVRVRKRKLSEKQRSLT